MSEFEEEVNQQIENQQLENHQDENQQIENQQIEHQQDQNQQDDDEQEDIDIDAGIDINNDENLFGSDDDDQQVQDDDNIGMKDLFGSDSDNDDTNNKETEKGHQEEEEDKVLSRKYIRSVPEGKKVTISTAIDTSEFPNNDKFEFCILRLPQVIDCDPDRFDEEQYIPSSTSSSIDNYIRWRAHYETASDETYKESNTKLVFWKDGTKSLIIGNDCYDIDQQILNGNRDYIYYNINDDQQNYKLSHSKINKRLNVRTTTQKSYKTLQKNLAKKHERTKGSKQLTALQRRHNRKKQEAQQQLNQQQRPNYNHNNYNSSTRKRKRSLNQSFLEQGGHGNNTSDDNDDDEDYNYNNKRHKQSSDSSSSNNNNTSDDESDSDDDDDDEPIGQRL